MKFQLKNRYENRVSIAVVFVIFAVEFMNTTANSTKTTAINDNAQIFFVFLANLSHLEQKKIIFKTNFGNVNSLVKIIKFDKK